MYQAVIFFFKVSQNFIVYESAEDWNLRTFLPEYKIHYLAIFLANTIVTGVPYFPARDKRVSLNRLSSRGLWKWCTSKVLDRRLYGVGQHFTFCRFSRKKFFGNFDCDFRKSFTKGFFSDWIWIISKFSFWRQMLDIYRQPLLNFAGITKFIKMDGIAMTTSCKWPITCTSKD